LNKKDSILIALGAFVLLAFTRKPDTSRKAFESALASYFQPGSLAYLNLLALAIHESGNFSNTLAKTRFNPFSMKNPAVRSTTSIARSGEIWAKYTGYKSALDDLILWFGSDWVKIGALPQDFLNYLEKRGYWAGESSEAYKNAYLNVYESIQ